MNHVIILPSDANYKGSLFDPKPQTLYYDDIPKSPQLENRKIFSFHNASIFQKVIEHSPNSPILIIERENFSLAHVYFLNDKAEQVSIPVGFTVFDVTNNVNIKKVYESFYLCWTDDYIFSYHSSQILKLSNMRQWSIS